MCVVSLWVESQFLQESKMLLKDKAGVFLFLVVVNKFHEKTKSS